MTEQEWKERSQLRRSAIAATTAQPGMPSAFKETVAEQITREAEKRNQDFKEHEVEAKVYKDWLEAERKKKEKEEAQRAHLEEQERNRQANEGGTHKHKRNPMK